PVAVELDDIDLAVAERPYDPGVDAFIDIDAETTEARYDAGMPVIETSERDAFLENNPEADRAVSEFWANVDREDDGNTDFLDYVFANKDVVSPEMLEGDNDSIAEELKARHEMLVAERTFEVQNHAWKKGRVAEVNNIT